MKKTLSILLSIAMLLSVAATANLSAYAGTYYESESNNTYQTANNLPINSIIYGSCSDDYDDDYYKFTLTQNAKVDISIPHTQKNDSGFWYVYIYKDMGSGKRERMINNEVYCYDGTYKFQSLGLSSGTYYVNVYTYSSSLKKVQYGVDLKVSYVDNWEREFNNTYQTSNSIEFGKKISGNCIDDYDDDYYTFKLTSPQTVKLSFSHTKVYDNGWWYVYIYKNLGSGKIETITDEMIYCYDGTFTFSNLKLSAGTYYVNVYTYSNELREVNYGLTLNYYIPTPSSLKVSTRNTTSLKLSWSKASGASGYQLQRKSGDSYKTVTNTSSTSATVSNLATATNYTFRVRAYKTINGTKYYSSWKSLTTPTKPGKVSIKAPSTNSKHQIIAKWSKVTRASGYQVQYCKNKSCSSVIATKTVSGQSKTSYTGKNFTKGKTYYVRVRAYKTYNGTKYYGAWSSVKSIKCK